ncbi:probable LRR receptor-like serine/threonine-protein kinase At3g47570 [Raphanus sativus]|uniref:non-specific serine/threonine protein kinase n=1 Tax=Raphanus sativus TaxID=3726 RepID=A0A6J0JW41_RAPSA|nr:probable LRR receptor-like serine/threonine-protein kinase At3g47570 [Raphanus sativus]
MQGEIPDDIARLSQMVIISLSNNNFSGDFPFHYVYNWSSLEVLSISANGLSGSLRPDLGNILPKIRTLFLGSNYFTGVIPATLSNISSLEALAIENNELIGSIPWSFGNIQNLQIMALNGNSLGSYSSGDLDFLDALTNCTQLVSINVARNRLGGPLPASITNLSRDLSDLQLGKNFISGSIPDDIGNLIGLQSLGLQENMLTGSLPESLGKLSGLGELYLYSNRMSGQIPFSIANITMLAELYLSNNSFDGMVPSSLGNCSQMLYLYLGFNKLTGIIPWEIMQIPSLIHLVLESNLFTGSLPKDVGRLQNLVLLTLGNNKLSGQLPQTLGNCLSMKDIWLQGNSFGGSIPDISGFLGVESVDLSNNNLYGSIPRYFANFSSLKLLNLSINNFEGYVPIEGVFQNASTVLVFGNKNLCGGIRELQLKPCLVETPPHHPSLLKKVVIGVSLGISFLLLLLFIASLRWYRKRKNDHLTNNQTTLTLGPFHEKISYGDIRNATDGFSSSNLIGSGSFGTVFKALLPGESNIVAVKVLNMQRRGAMKSFMAECESLKDTRHRNLVRLLTACSSIDFQGNEFKALIYEFMPSGSLDVWLHPEEVEEVHRPLRTLTLLERLNIVIDVASVLDYLHVQCHEPIAHCDLKPSNVLLDSDLTAHVSDFGLARLLLKFDEESFFNQLSSSGVRGTIGYAAPEYGMGGQPSIHGDVYSFGVLLLEVFTGKRPTDELFGGNFTLHNYTKSSLPERVLEIADKSIYHNGLRVGFPISECLTLVLDVGLRCCEDSPSNRLAMSEAVKELISVREKFFKSRRTARS